MILGKFGRVEQVWAWRFVRLGERPGQQAAVLSRSFRANGT